MDHSDAAQMRAGREELVQHGLRLLDDGLAIGTAGNLSLRLGDTVLITPSGVSYRNLTPTDICQLTLTPTPDAAGPAPAGPAPSGPAPAGPAIAGSTPAQPAPARLAPAGPVDSDGSPIAAALASVPAEASSELPLHLAVYSATGATAIVHTHSPEVVALSAVRDDLPAIHYAITALGGPVRVAGYERFGSHHLAQSAVAALPGRKAVILRNHGAVSYGNSLPQAYDRALLLEWLAHVYRMARSLGTPHILTADDLNEVAAEMHRRHYGEPQ